MQEFHSSHKFLKVKAKEPIVRQLQAVLNQGGHLVSLLGEPQDEYYFDVEDKGVQLRFYVVKTQFIVNVKVNHKPIDLTKDAEQELEDILNAE